MQTVFIKVVGFIIWAFLSWLPLGLHRIWMEGFRRSDWWMYPVAVLFQLVLVFVVGAGFVPPAALPIAAFFSGFPYLVLVINDGLRFLRGEYQVHQPGDVCEHAVGEYVAEAGRNAQ